MNGINQRRTVINFLYVLSRRLLGSCIYAHNITLCIFCLKSLWNRNKRCTFAHVEMLVQFNFLKGMYYVNIEDETKTC